MTFSLSTLNTVSKKDALAMIEPLVEKSPWVAAAALTERPFSSDKHVAKALVKVILSEDMPSQVALFNAHPELAGAEAKAGVMTKESTSEQDRLGLMHLSSQEAQQLAHLNAAYKSKFGHPFILALHRVPDREALFEIFERRLKMSEIEEHTATLSEIASVISARCRHAFGDPLPSQVPNTLKNPE
ncbi:2-oxo-4-hydroxy-4-carboxy-5-ureidoimidazoline decarboxylase [Thalassospira sp.]|uniref:2-oxo-4-hydroxy-4-carboxy-5-ureidoimidazoline decarboxylase n=1 Tax=Thalassospira sp. TaxID=1912094 RepID=UPI0032EF1D8D